MSLSNETFIESLIEEIEKRPALYKKNLKEYSDTNIKRNLWEEVCENVVPDWSQLDGEEKRKQGHEVQKKWANLRTCFRREYNAQNNTKSGQSTTKRRKYIYYDKLLFLLPCIDNRATEGDLGPAEDQDVGDDEIYNDETGACTVTSTLRQKKSTRDDNKITKEVEGPGLKGLEVTKDEDTNFALSLVPSLQSLTAEEKLDAKINILQVFKQIRLARRREVPFACGQNVRQCPVPHLVHRRAANVPPREYHSADYSGYGLSHNLAVHIATSTPSPGCSSDTAQSFYSNFTDDSD